MNQPGDIMSIQRPVVTHDPENSETPLSEMRSWVTPNVFFFVRNHFDEPDIAPEAWRLHVHGHVRSPRVWTWEELAAPSRADGVCHNGVRRQRALLLAPS